MRILLTVHQFVPGYSTGGTEILTYSVATEFLRRGHEVFVLTGHPDWKQNKDTVNTAEYEIDGIHVYQFFYNFSINHNQTTVKKGIEYNNSFSASYFARILEDIKPDIVHFFHFMRLGINLVDIAVSKGIPAYYTPTDFWAICPTSMLILENGVPCNGPGIFGGNCVKHIASRTKKGRRHQRLLNFLPTKLFDIAIRLNSFLRLGGHYGKGISAIANRHPFNISKLNLLEMIFSPTHLMTKMLIKNGVRSDLIKQLEYGIAIFNNENHVRQRNDKAYTFGFIGNLAPHKGCHILIQAFKCINNISGLRLKIYGNVNFSPEYYSRLEVLAEGTGNTIEFCGTFPNERIGAVLSEIDVLVVPSLWYENSPLVLHSAQVAKCPVVASNFPGMSEMVQHQKNGLLFPPGDIYSLADCLRLLAITPNLLTQLSAGCKNVNSCSKYIDELESVYMQDA